MLQIVSLDKGIPVLRLKKALASVAVPRQIMPPLLLLCPSLSSQATQAKAIRNIAARYVENVRALRATPREPESHLVVLMGHRPARLVNELAAHESLNLFIDPRLRVVSVAEDDEHWQRWLNEPALCPSLTDTVKSALEREIATSVLVPAMSQGWLRPLLFHHVTEILRRHSERAHENHHIRHTLEDGKVRKHVAGQKRALTKALGTFVTGARIQEFDDAWEQTASAVEPFDKTQYLKHWAKHLDESCAVLELATEQAKLDERRHHVLVIEDDPKSARSVCSSLRKRLGESVEVKQVLVCNETGFDDVIQGAVNRCEDPSSAAASFILNQLARSCLDRYYGEWVELGSITVIVVDVRWHPSCPKAGLEFLRLTRDRYPFIKVVASTIRSGVAHALADEDVDGYVLKSDNPRVVAKDVGSAVETCLRANAVLCSPEMSDVLSKDLVLNFLVRDRYGLVDFDADNTTPLRLLLCASGEVEGMGSRIQNRTVLGISVEEDFHPRKALELARLGKQFGAAACVILHRMGQRTRRSVFYPSSLVRLGAALRPDLPVRFDTRWTLLVPKSAHYGPLNVLVGGETRQAFRYDLAAHFGGATSVPAEGVWYATGVQKEIRDKHERLEIWGRNTEKGREHVLRVARRIMSELNQEEVVVEEQNIRTYSVTPSLPKGISAAFFDADNLLNLPFASPASL